ncbi:MAG: hypothetical protein J5746_05670, partial [Victivallales bacterium]|nr:hypothetical protein [Victivallales bacterium]
MRAIVNPYSSRQSWSRDVLPEWSLCALPIAGKPYCEHCLDFLLGQEVKSVIVEDCSNYSQSLKMDISVGKYTPMEVQYVGTSMDSSMRTLLMRNTKFIEGDDVLVFWGMVLPENLADEEILGNLLTVDANAATLDDGIYLLRGRQLFRCVLPLRRIDGIQSYFKQNFEMLNDSKGYILPGYSADNGIYTGMNVAIKQDVTITPNVLLGDTLMERTQFENYALAPRFADVPEGLMPMLYPGDTTLGEAHWIPNFCMWSIIQLADYACRSGDAALAAMFRAKAEGILAWFRKSRNPEGLLENLPGWVF